MAICDKNVTKQKFFDKMKNSALNWTIEIFLYHDRIFFGQTIFVSLCQKIGFMELL